MHENAAREKSQWLVHVPIAVFSAVMGLTGLGLAWRKAHHVFDWPTAIGESILGLAVLVFAAVTILYAAKILRHGATVRGEFEHPVRSNFFPTFSVSLILLAMAAFPLHGETALVLWGAGAAVHMALTLNLIGRWLVRDVSILAINPAWFIPAVGNILVPIVGVRLGFPEISWLFFSIGLVFWLLLFVIVFYRIVFHDQMPPRLVPTMFILIAPPTAGFQAYFALTGGVIDSFSRILFYFGLYLTILLFSLARTFIAVPFAMSWWAFTFPLCAMTIAALEYGQYTGGWGLVAIAAGLLGLTTVIVTTVFLRTVKALFGGTLFTPE
jgi:tellurite resistance protein